MRLRPEVVAALPEAKVRAALPTAQLRYPWRIVAAGAVAGLLIVAGGFVVAVAVDEDATGARGYAGVGEGGGAGRQRGACRLSCCPLRISPAIPVSSIFADGVTEDLTTDLSRNPRTVL